MVFGDRVAALSSFNTASVMGAQVAQVKSPKAVEIAGRNLGNTKVVTAGDVRSLDRPDGSVDASVSNLPFGRQYEVTDSIDDWLRAALDELARVTRSGGRIVLLAPKLPGLPKTLHHREKHPITLLGTRTTIWVLDRR